MAIALVDSITNTASAATPISATLPGGAPAAGRVLIAVVHADTSSEQIEPADGLAWRVIQNQNGSNSSFYVWVRTAGASEPASYSFRRVDLTADNFSLNITVWSGVNPAHPVFDADSFLLDAANSTLVIPAFTTALADVVVVTVLGIGSTTTVLTPPSTYTLASEIDGFNPGSSVYYKAQAVAGTTGTITWVLAASTVMKGAAFALRPDPGYLYAQAIVGDGANTDNGGGNAWTTPENAEIEDVNLASVTVAGTAATDFLDGTTLGFALHADAVIKGYEVLVGRRLRSGGTTGNARDNTVQLFSGGVAVGNNKAITTSWPSADRKSLLYGHPDDLWGATLTPANVNSSTFGARFALQGAAAGADRVGSFDFLEVTVYYTLPARAATFAGTLKLVAALDGAFTPPETPEPDTTSTTLASGWRSYARRERWDEERESVIVAEPAPPESPERTEAEAVPASPLAAVEADPDEELLLEVGVLLLELLD